MKKYAEIVNLDGERLFPLGKRVHTCSVCGKQDIWGKDWEWYGSYKDMDEDIPLIKTCFKECKEKRKQT